MKFILSVLFVAAFSMSSFAEEESASTGPCHDDVQKFCKEVRPGKGRIVKCMKEHESEISQTCKDHRAKIKEERKEARKERRDACREDMEKHCKDIKAGGGARVKCLKENKEKLSQECQSSMGKPRKNRKEK